MDTANPDPGSAAPRFERYDCSGGCPVEGALEQIAGKWKGLIIYHVMEGTLRFNELARRVGGVTQRSLTKQLRELEANGIAHREVFAVVPPRGRLQADGQGPAASRRDRGARRLGHAASEMTRDRMPAPAGDRLPGATRANWGGS
ncbi:putative HTH-type transcriptional regulator YybR [Defluviimonas aquaemixtae]|uniref:Putative HTH-type transcriptional regulator YybR n=1 Tax=Albidovulum aquaemixtae TaxID=1542388 RepID=A0A2R8B4I5_9RHOB|nr:putative HTH-type transcriptional regulator YybR [Defluviimonas aquaemixtae]